MAAVIMLFGYSKVVKSAVKENFEVYNILLPEMLEQSFYRKTLTMCKQTVVIQTIDDLDRAVKELTSNNDILSVVAVTDKHNAVCKAMEYNDTLLSKNVVAPKETVQLLCDKSKARKQLDDIGLRNVKYIVSDSVDEIISFYHTIGADIVLKPLAGEGSNGVARVSSVDEINMYFKQYGVSMILAEEFISGKEYSVESITVKGKTTILGVTEKVVIGENDFGHNPFVEMAHVFPANLVENDKKAIFEYIEKFFDSLEIYNGLGHSEIILTSDGPVLIESHLRMGGDFIPKLVENSSGINGYSLFLKSLRDDVVVNVNYNAKSAVKYIIPKSPYIEKSLDSISSSDYITDAVITITDGSVAPISSSYDRVYGFVIAKTEDDPLQFINEYLKELEIDIL